MVAFAQSPARADDDDGELSFCNFGPKVNVVTSPKETPSAEDPCADKVRVQGVLWKCGSPDRVDGTVEKFFKDLNEQAQEECNKHCERNGPNCHGIYTKKQACGLTTDREDAVALGKRFGCRKDCADGKAFMYCSIYNAGYQGPNPDRVLAQKPNCECRSGS